MQPATIAGLTLFVRVPEKPEEIRTAAEQAEAHRTSAATGESSNFRRLDRGPARPSPPHPTCRGRTACKLRRPRPHSFGRRRPTAAWRCHIRVVRGRFPRPRHFINYQPFAKLRPGHAASMRLRSRSVCWKGLTWGRHASNAFLNSPGGVGFLTLSNRRPGAVVIWDSSIG